MSAKISGDKIGIALWNIMVNTNDVGEREYLDRIVNAVGQYRVAWFTDIVTQRESGKCEPMWQMTWDDTNLRWNISRFSTPSNGNTSTKRIDEAINKVIELELDDLLKS